MAEVYEEDDEDKENDKSDNSNSNSGNNSNNSNNNNSGDNNNGKTNSNRRAKRPNAKKWQRGLVYFVVDEGKKMNQAKGRNKGRKGERKKDGMNEQ